MSPTDHTNYQQCLPKSPFILIGKSRMAFSTGQSWCLSKSWYTGGGQNKNFGTVSSVAQANIGNSDYVFTNFKTKDS